MTPEQAQRRVARNFDRRSHAWFKWNPGPRIESTEMAYEQKNNSGNLFRNDRREKDSQPHAKGKALIDGVWYWLSAWTNEPRGGGDKFQSISFERMTDEQAAKYSDRGGDATSRALNNPPRQMEGSRGPSHRTPQSPFGDEQHFEDDSIPF
jgi:hypothetical protein